jgi:hypothetical protein
MNWPLTSAVTLLLVLTGATIRMFGSLLNPMYLTFAIEFILRTLVGYVAYYYVFPSALADPEFLDAALWLSMLYATCFSLGVAIRNEWLQGLISRVSQVSVRSSDEGAEAMAFRAALAVALVGLVCLLSLAVLGGGGSLWLTDTRAAYLSHRSGFGFLWSMFASSVPLSMLLLVHLRRTTLGWHYVAVGAVYVVLAYFSGSKQTILAVVLGLLFYRHYYVRALSTPRLVGVFGVLVVMFFTTAVVQGSFESLFESISYVDYMHMSAKYLELEDSLSNIQGSGVVSYLWSFVPRAFAPDKPFEYGIVLINSVLAPGAAEEGYTPAYLEWTLLHLDFGFLGVAALGFLKGQFVSSFFRVFQQNMDNLFVFLFTCHLGFMIFNVPGVYELALLLSLGVAWAIKRLSDVRVTI